MGITPVGGGVSAGGPPPLSRKEVAQILAEMLAHLTHLLIEAKSKYDGLQVLVKNMPWINQELEFAEKNLPPGDPLIQEMKALKEDITKAQGAYFWEGPLQKATIQLAKTYQTAKEEGGG